MVPYFLILTLILSYSYHILVIESNLCGIWWSLVGSFDTNLISYITYHTSKNNIFSQFIVLVTECWTFMYLQYYLQIWFHYDQNLHFDNLKMKAEKVSQVFFQPQRCHGDALFQIYPRLSLWQRSQGLGLQRPHYPKWLGEKRLVVWC